MTALRDAEAKGDPLFAPTRWSLIACMHAEGSKTPRRALSELCGIYWQPLYLYLRRRDFNAHDAQDLTQGFFAEIIETRSYLRADRAKGHFRSFLLGALKHFVAHERDYDRAQKRGGGVTIVSMSAAELAQAEENRELNGGNVELIFEREWAAALLRRTHERLKQECTVAGKAKLFERLEPHLAENGQTDYQTLSRELGRPVTTLRSDMGRFRARYRAILREEVADTVATPGEVDEELRYLCRVASVS